MAQTRIYTPETVATSSLLKCHGFRFCKKHQRYERNGTPPEATLTKIREALPQARVESASDHPKPDQPI